MGCDNKGAHQSNMAPPHDVSHTQAHICIVSSHRRRQSWIVYAMEWRGHARRHYTIAVFGRPIRVARDDITTLWPLFFGTKINYFILSLPYTATMEACDISRHIMWQAFLNRDYYARMETDFLSFR